MNKKLIAAAVSAAVMAPVAHAESSFYARVNNAIDINDLSGDGTTDVSGVASRFGFKGSADVGNGMTVHGRYEFSTTSDKEGTGVGDTRIATAGLSGGFGRIDVGNQWSAYFDTFGTLISPTYSLGYYLYSSVGGGPYRSSNTIKYSNTFGPLYAELDVRLNDSGEGGDVAEKIRGNGVGLGLSFSVTDNITIAAAFDSEDGADIAAIDALGFDDLAAGDQEKHTAESKVSESNIYEAFGSDLDIAVGLDDVYNKAVVANSEDVASSVTDDYLRIREQVRLETIYSTIPEALVHAVSPVPASDVIANDGTPESFGADGVLDPADGGGYVAPTTAASAGSETSAADQIPAVVGVKGPDSDAEIDKRIDAGSGTNLEKTIAKADAKKARDEGISTQARGILAGLEKERVDAVENAIAARDAARDANQEEIDAKYGYRDAEPKSRETDIDRFGIAIKATFGNYWGSIGLQNMDADAVNDANDADIDTTFLWVGGSLGDKTSWLVGLAEADDGNAGSDDSSQTTWGIYHNLGGGIKLYYEAISLDSGDNDGDRHLLGMRVDF